MPIVTIFQAHLILGYVAWLLAFSTYIWPWLKSLSRADAQRAIATLHGFRFFGLVFIVPGVVGNLPERFATVAAYGDFATGVLALLALVTFRMRPLFWLFVVAFNIVGIADLVTDYIDATLLHVPEHAGELAATYWIPVLFVPILMITHAAAFVLMVRREAGVWRARAESA
ncbi:MAG TPA: hypothetical protein VHC42_04850 [Rhizomicrobium sp.]|nr:hypothetical protein [Rhizomicrobium sp.]